MKRTNLPATHSQTAQRPLSKDLQSPIYAQLFAQKTGSQQVGYPGKGSRDPSARASVRRRGVPPRRTDGVLGEELRGEQGKYRDGGRNFLVENFLQKKAGKSSGLPAFVFYHPG